jgi:polysaccharide export outer membrane protein
MPRRYAFGLVAALIAVPSLGVAQQGEAWDPGRVQVTRADLQDLLRRLEDAAASSTYSQPLRDQARLQAQQIRTRLAEGDFQVGDRIGLSVEGEATLTDTFTVMDGRRLRLPTLGDVALAGVLRSELEDHLRSVLGQYLRNPVIRARSFIRISLMGEVAHPGYYVVPTDMVLSDALMLAGGPSGSAKLPALRVERSGRAVWADAPLQQAIAQGRTLDQLGLQAGDQVVVPRKGGGFFSESTVRTIGLIIALPVAIYGTIQIFK